MNYSRRDFLRKTSIAGTGMMMSSGGLAINGKGCQNECQSNQLLALNYDLLEQWMERLVQLQIRNYSIKGLHGGILCPACSRVHGRVGDAIFPLMYLAEKKQEKKYLDAAISLYDWMEEMVSVQDGSWVNDVNISSWKGTTIFYALSLAEALTNYGKLLDLKTKERWEKRLLAATRFAYNTINAEYGNINYLVVSSYAFSLIGRYFNDGKIIRKGRDFAHQSLRYFTDENAFLFGEGNPKLQKSPKGCYPIDLGYNVEESLPALVSYALLTKDEKVLDVAIKSLKTHMEFMLPDGGWDNSWGTRNFKWSYWGSRTCDGCQPAYVLLSDKVPEFYKVALENTRLLYRCTSNGYLYGGLHYTSHGVLPCIHHAITHSKALAFVLHQFEHSSISNSNTNVLLPRAKRYGVKTFSDIQTWLVSIGGWRATITGYDCEYKMKNGHATGGAMSLLWHEKGGPIITASMNKYSTVESGNMQMHKGIKNMSLTPRFEFEDSEGRLFMNTADLNASISFNVKKNATCFHTLSYLVDENQEEPVDGGIKSAIDYTFHDSSVTIKAKCFTSDFVNNIKFYLPIISQNSEQVEHISSNQVNIHKPAAIVNILSSAPVTIAKTKKGRIFNFVPGVEAVPIEITSNEMEIQILVN